MVDDNKGQASANALNEAVERAADRVVQLEAELEAAGDVTTQTDQMAAMRALLHDWVDTVTAVISTPGVGRVVLIHDNGRESRIASPDLPSLLAQPVRFT